MQNTKKNPLACKHYGNEVEFQLLQNMVSGHVKVRKGTGHVFYMVTPCHSTESVSTVFSLIEAPLQ